MARRRTARSIMRRRTHPAPAPALCGDDPLSALPDDLLLLVLRRLDARTAHGTALLSRRWARLHRQLPALDFRKVEFRHKIQRYERGAMRALNRSVDSFLEDQGARRSVSRLRLDFFITHNPGCINRLISKSIDDWGVSDLEAVAKPTYIHRSVHHTFPDHGLCQDPRSSCLRSLKLGGCTLPPLHDFSALTMLVLQDIPSSTPTAAYEGVFTLCPQLQVLHLKSCERRWEDKELVVDAPSSQIRELVFDKCTIGPVRMRALPKLQSLASRDTSLYFGFTSFPCLRQCNHTKRIGSIFEQNGRREYVGHQRELGSFLRCTPDITNLVVRFTGPRRWIVPPPRSYSLSLPKLRKLLVADVPSSWDAAWPLLLLEMAPCLETFHIHIAPCKESPGRLIPWQSTKLRRHHLKELVVSGFQGKRRQIYLVQFVVGVSTALHRVGLFKSGHAQEKGHWDWEMVTEQHSCTDEEKDAMRKKIMGGVSFSHPSGRLIFG